MTTQRLIFSLPFFVFFTSFCTSAADLRTSTKGIEIAAGSLGTFILTYPEFEPEQKMIEVKAAGKQAEVKYEGGAVCILSVDKEQVKVSLQAVPAGVKSWKMATLIDIGFAKGGSWKIGDQSGSFPAEKSAPPQIASLNSTSFVLKNAQGQSLLIETPDFAFQQLTDNREWNWAIYHWQFIVPWMPDRAQATIQVTSDLSSVTKLIDPFGQSLKDTFPNKIKSLNELKADVEEDKAYYSKIEAPERDRFGGLPGSGEMIRLKKTGFFHVECKSEKTWLVDPEGNAFFHLGVCGFAPNDDFTYVQGREGIYEWLPSNLGEFSTAFREGNSAHFSFYIANTIKKFGAAFDYESHAARMIERVKKWGFNSMGAFTPPPRVAHVQASFPYVAHLPINEWEGVKRLPGAHEVWDPFDNATAIKIEENIAREVPARAKDPLLIGWFIVNEPRFDELPRVIPALDGEHACKREFVASLKAKYTTIEAFNAAWKTKADSFDALVNKGLAVTTDAAKSDLDKFVGFFLETYFSQIEKAFRKHDSNHLLLGCRLQPITIENEQLCRTMGKHVDVVSYNYYTYGIDPSALRRYHEWTGGKPMMLSEFFWASPKDSGLIGGREVSSQQERGLAYRNYVEQSAVLGFIVGIEWFTLVDQAATGRWFSQYNGESYNTGLISVADRPWKDMLAEMMKTNHTIYELLLSKRQPFLWDDPRFQEK